MKRVVIIKIGALVRYASKTPKKVLRIFLARETLDPKSSIFKNWRQTHLRK